MGTCPFRLPDVVSYSGVHVWSSVDEIVRWGEPPSAFVACNKVAENSQPKVGGEVLSFIYIVMEEVHGSAE